MGYIAGIIRVAADWDGDSRDFACAFTRRICETTSGWRAVGRCFQGGGGGCAAAVVFVRSDPGGVDCIQTLVRRHGAEHQHRLPYGLDVDAASVRGPRYGAAPLVDGEQLLGIAANVGKAAGLPGVQEIEALLERL